MLYRRKHWRAVNLRVFLCLQRRNGLLQHTADNEVSALARLTFYENLLIGQETSVRCLH